MLDYLSVLKTFVAVVECGSMIEASRARGYSAGAVTRQIGWLQRRIGLRLFDPSGRSIQPTAAAIRLVEFARTVIREAERFDHVARDLANARSGRADATTEASPRFPDRAFCDVADIGEVNAVPIRCVGGSRAADARSGRR